MREPRIEDAQREKQRPLCTSLRWAVASVLRLQRAVGNGAVTVRRARSGPDAPPPAPAPGVSLPSPPRPIVSPDEKAFDDAVKSGDWATAATSLAKLAMPTTKLPPLTIDQLRLLQDAVTRAHSVLGGVGIVLQLAIAAELQGKGVPATKVAAGAAFGKLETTVDERIDGDKATGTLYAYKINITFTPDNAVIDADEIAFIQTTRLVETASGSNEDHKHTNKKRQTPSATSVDRLRGKKQGWYGMTMDNGMGSGALTVWKKSAPATPAKMRDRASWNQPNTTWQFETMVVCRSGTDAGKVYAVVTWGFTVDGDLKLTEQAPTVTNKQSTEATTAVGNWNDQAAGAAVDRNAPGQMSLPALK
ncbi:MAG TPA: hypothetical protein VGO16_03285 [Pseudonocardiaceae bacterium]|nr:hypothetical protein [Pseudonocardiaceae bacterium]